MMRIEVKPELIRWARERAGIDPDVLTRRFPQFRSWERGAAQPTFRQLEDFAKATLVPIGYLFLPEPPEEPLPIPDFRTAPGAGRVRPSPNLLDTIYTMQRRQAWLREERVECESEPLQFVGSARLTDDPDAVGREMRRIIGFEEGWAAKVRTWTQAVGELRRAIEQLGVMTVINGVVGNNTHRTLDTEEFLGFALCDKYAPLLFVNGADYESRKMFTLAHELAHIWLGSVGEGLSGFESIFPGGTQVEDFCDRAAAEFLVPAKELNARWGSVKDEPQPFETLAQKFKVSPIVVGRRAMDLRLVDRETFFDFYRAYVKRERTRKKSTGGGDFYNNQNTRVGALFATQVVRAAKEGRIGFKEAYDLTGLHGGAFQEYANRLGIVLP
ncbi:MAG: ImmA/IrrE family metallo-endopeptidase [Candidatus Omnitrophica bacterium]|nr:ImmA/IrrE family metallo-endopeptidase [Candidatus Omnitrophota bacterium]